MRFDTDTTIPQSINPYHFGDTLTLNLLQSSDQNLKLWFMTKYVQN